jgi:hypothetical protein
VEPFPYPETGAQIAAYVTLGVGVGALVLASDLTASARSMAVLVSSGVRARPAVPRALTAAAAQAGPGGARRGVSDPAPMPMV